MIIAGGPVKGARRQQQATKTGAWMTVQPSTVKGTDLGAQEWRDSLLLRYGLGPPDLPNYCDGYNAKLLICHALDCKRGSFVTARHKDLQYRVADLEGKAFTLSHVRNDPLIFADCAVNTPKAKPDRTTGSTDQDNTPLPEATKQKGDLPIRDL